VIAFRAGLYVSELLVGMPGFEPGGKPHFS
jgi:hypothetical protein